MWQVLGIDATNDPAVIRRAYAARLKALDADREPEAFRTLRQAYEAALRGAERAVRRRVPPPPAPKEKAGDAADEDARELPPATDHSLQHVPPPRDPTLVAAEQESAAVDERFRRALQQRAWSDAAAVLVSASARGLLPLLQEDSLAAQVMSGALEDRDFPAPSLAALARQLHWDEPLTWHRSADDDLRQRVRARLEADTWYARVLAQAAYRPRPGLQLHGRFWGDPKQIERTAAAMILGQTSPRSARHFRKWLDPLLEEGERHQAALAGRIDPAILAQLRAEIGRGVAKPVSKRRVWLWILVLIGLAHLLGLILNNN